VLYPVKAELYWNSDPTNLPAKMHSFYLRNMYLENRLAEGGINLLGTKIDLSKVDVPSFFLAAKDDHIAPWRSVYAGLGLLGGKKIFCLSASGHVAGVVNPPHQNKYSYWSSSDVTDNPDEWLANSTENMGSWWGAWLDWQERHSGDVIEEVTYAKLKQIEPAPGSYVKVSI